MNTHLPHVRTLPLLCLAVFAVSAASCSKSDKTYGEPDRLEAEIVAFEEKDAAAPPPENAVVFAGSSSFRMWHEWLVEDLAPVTVIGRGFGGSKMNELLHYADRIAVNYKPRAIAVYEGDNDIAGDIPPATFAAEFRKFVAKAKSALPEVRIYFVSIKPSIARWDMWPRMQEANRLIAEICAEDPNLNYIDISAVMLGPDGKPDPSIFLDDGLHMNREGYLRWKDVLQRELVAKEIAYE